VLDVGCRDGKLSAEIVKRLPEGSNRPERFFWKAWGPEESYLLSLGERGTFWLVCRNLAPIYTEGAREFERGIHRWACIQFYQASSFG